MIIPSIDVMGGRAVQLVQGRKKVLDAGDPRPLAERFGRVGEVAVVDLDAALGRGSNAGVIRELCRLAPCRVGGGIRDRDAAVAWLDEGARKVVLGTAAVPEVLEQLPRERVVAALDHWQGEVVVRGWTERTGQTVREGIDALRELAGGFLVTFVEGEGKESGFPREQVAELAKAAGGVRLTVAGGITTAREIAWLDRTGADAQVGMALYRGTLDLADAFTAPLRSERDDGLWPTIVADDRGIALGLVWSSAESVRAAINEGKGVYHSRRRGLWRKGAQSGATQTLLRIDPDCDRDALRFTVVQEGLQDGRRGRGFCHTGDWSCFGPAEGLRALEQLVAARASAPVEGSLTRRLLDGGDDGVFLRGKLIEEAGEVADAIGKRRVTEEAADLLYFLAVAMGRAGVSWAEVEGELDRRRMAVSRKVVSAPKGAACEVEREAGRGADRPRGDRAQ